MERKTIDGWTLEPIRPHLLGVRWDGPYTKATNDGSTEYIEAYRAELGGEDAGIWVIIEMIEGGRIDKSARKSLLESGKRQPFRATAFVGGSRRLRVAAELIGNAVSLLMKDAAPIKFVDSKEEGLAWLEGLMEGEV